MEILAEAVKYFIGKKEILKGIDLALRPKEFLGIIGPNGSGKSTFLKCVYRVQKPTEGTIRFDWRWWHSTIIIILIFLCSMWC